MVMLLEHLHLPSKSVQTNSRVISPTLYTVDIFQYFKSGAKPTVPQPSKSASERRDSDQEQGHEMESGEEGVEGGKVEGKKGQVEGEEAGGEGGKELGGGEGSQEREGGAGVEVETREKEAEEDRAMEEGGKKDIVKGEEQHPEEAVNRKRKRKMVCLSLGV